MHASFEHRHSVLASTTAVALHLPKTMCPVRRHLLRFHHWLRYEILVPYKADTAST